MPALLVVLFCSGLLLAGPRKGPVFFEVAMRWLQYWHACFAVDAAYGVCRMSMQRDFSLYLKECMDMQIKEASAEERTLMVSALELAIASCERRANRTGEVSSIKEELARHAEKYRLLKSAIVLTK